MKDTRGPEGIERTPEMILFQGHLETGTMGEVPRVSFTVSEVFPRQEWGGIIPVERSFRLILRLGYSAVGVLG